MPRTLLVTTALLACLATVEVPAFGTIRVLSAVGMRQVMLDLATKFQRESGHTLDISFEASGLIAQRLEQGERVDVVLINQAGIDRLMHSGTIMKDSSAALATAIVGAAVLRGEASPDISTPESFKSAMLKARSVSYPDPALDGSSGVHIASVFERLGITAAMKPKTIYADPPGPNAATPGSLVATRKADIALHQMQELRAVPGIQIVGPLPAELQQTFVFSVAIAASASDVAAARALLEFLQGADSRAVMIAKGMGIPRP